MQHLNWRPPIPDVASGVGLGMALAAVPKDAPEAVRNAAHEVQKATLALQAA
jgi:hypothetical protein